MDTRLKQQQLLSEQVDAAGVRYSGCDWSLKLKKLPQLNDGDNALDVNPRRLHPQIVTPGEEPQLMCIPRR